MARKPQSKSKLTDAERHARFVDTAREVDASEDPVAFEEAFTQVTGGSAKPTEREEAGGLPKTARSERPS